MEYVKRKSCETNMILVATGYYGRFSLCTQKTEKQRVICTYQTRRRSAFPYSYRTKS